MNKKIITTVLVCMTAISIVACGRKTDEFHSTGISDTEVSNQKQDDELHSTEKSDTEVSSQIQNDGFHSTDIGNTEVANEKPEEPMIQFTSTYGYSIKYYSTFLKLLPMKVMIASSKKIRI